MEGLDINSLERLMESEKAGDNAVSFSNMFEQVGKIISEGDKILNFINKCEKSPIVSLVVKGQAAKAGVTDYAPLQQETAAPVGVVPASDVHQAAFEQLNNLTPEQLQAMIGAQQANTAKPEDETPPDQPAA